MTPTPNAEWRGGGETDRGETRGDYLNNKFSRERRG